MKSINLDPMEMVDGVCLEGGQKYTLESTNKLSSEYLRLHSLGNGRSVISGGLTDFHASRAYTNNINFRKFEFAECDINDLWLDTSTFKGVKFRNCHFKCEFIRWCVFDGCTFDNCFFDIKYIRSSTFKKNCTVTNLKVTVHQVDEYMFLLGKRFGSGVYDAELTQYCRLTNGVADTHTSLSTNGSSCECS